MNLVNTTGLAAGWCLGFQVDGRERLVVAVKGTYDLSQLPNQAPELAGQQAPLTKADEFTGEPGCSATLHESDYSHHKLACDVIVNGSAYAPHGDPARAVVVGLSVGPIRKRFGVVGDRVWTSGLHGSKLSDPRPFVRLPISYDCAYGGTEVSPTQPEAIETYAENPIGVGFYPQCKDDALAGKPASNTHELGVAAVDRQGKYRPMAFGARSRSAPGRVKYAGTYDTRWTEERAPFWPFDFDERYFQTAPEDQQMPFPVGGELVSLENLTPEGSFQFRLPLQQIPIVFVAHQGPEVQRDACLDTVLIEPDEQRLMLTWRASLAMKRSVFDMREIIVGQTARAHQVTEQQSTKKRYASLGDAVRDLRRIRGGR